jgi:hypothetical protein
MIYLNGTAKGCFEDKIFLDGAEQCDVRLNGVSGTTRRGTLTYDDPFSNNGRHIEQFGIRDE